MPAILAATATNHNLILVTIIIALMLGIALGAFAYIRAIARVPIAPSETVRNLVAGHWPVAAMFQYRNETGASWQEAQQVIDALRREATYAA